jgi:hypothetical protein
MSLWLFLALFAALQASLAVILADLLTAKTEAALSRHAGHADAVRAATAG